MNLKNLTTTERQAFDTISSEAISVVKDNAEGVEFVRVNLYQDAFEDLLKNGETEKEIVGAHFFTNFQSDDIDKENQNEIGNDTNLFSFSVPVNHFSIFGERPDFIWWSTRVVYDSQ